MQYSASYSISLFLVLRSRMRRKPRYLRLPLSLPLRNPLPASPRLSLAGRAGAAVFSTLAGAASFMGAVAGDATGAGVEQPQMLASNSVTSHSLPLVSKLNLRANPSYPNSSSGGYSPKRKVNHAYIPGLQPK